MARYGVARCLVLTTANILIYELVVGFMKKVY